MSALVRDIVALHLPRNVGRPLETSHERYGASASAQGPACGGASARVESPRRATALPLQPDGIPTSGVWHMDKTFLAVVILLPD